MASSPQNQLAQSLKALHNPGNPLILTNVWDAITANAIASLPSTKALATASYAIAAAAGLHDDDLTLETNLRAATAIAGVAKVHNLPLSVDFMDGFGAQLEEGVKRVIELGAVGINLEDFGREVGGLYSVDEASERVRRVLRVAKECGVPDFVVNARTDALFAGEGLEDAIVRGKAYLDAGASNIFIWGGPQRRGWGRAEVKKAVDALDGKVNVILIRMMAGGLSVGELREIGVARISVGPQLMLRTVEMVKREAVGILDGSAVTD
ncbi:PEP phosphonomutase-like protein [Ophiobolus disseminans]|uniref:PEP phosphonomutase-like protein n=1 Tax=Ophiobolus disseminans TaxID=1469910 RepID=A0A6A7A8E5_9PLEO|nr:PEP phosphonomutase-like protein [Ophiobolus disseminans]